MRNVEDVTESCFTRRVFAAWSIDVPASFEEAFVGEESYWHAWDRDRSMSLTSVVLTDQGEPVPAAAIAAQFPVLDGEPVTQLPAGVLGCAAIMEAEQPAIASMALSGLLAVYGRALVVSITSDDLDWSRQVFRSIRIYAAPIEEPRPDRATRCQAARPH
jgi:hypothetical protein